MDPATGKKDVVVKYVSDPDALPAEHEEEHRRIVGLLLQGGLVSAGELGRVIVERVAPEASEAGTSEPSPQATRAKVGQGS